MDKGVHRCALDVHPCDTLRTGIDLTAIWRPLTGIFASAMRLTGDLLLIDKQNRYTLFFAGELHPEFQEWEDTSRPVVVPLREEVISKQLLLSPLCKAHRVSNEAERNILGALRLPESKVNVIYEGIDDGFPSWNLFNEGR